LKRKHRIGIASITIALVITFILGLFIFGSKGINLLASVEETRYIYLSSQRESLIYDLYKKISKFQVDIETISDIEKYEDRSRMAREYKKESENLVVELSNLLSKYDLKLLNYNVNNELTLLANNYYKNDVLLLDQQNYITEYLELEYQFNTYLFAKAEIIRCYTNIKTTEDNLTILNTFKICLDKSKVIAAPSSTLLPESIKYEQLLSTYLNKNIELYQLLDQSNISRITSLQSEISNLYKQIQAQNSIANNEIISTLTKTYLKIGQVK